MSKHVLMIDPPEGWKYGFPKPLGFNKCNDLVKWLIDNGYPSQDAESAIKHTRMFYGEE